MGKLAHRRLGATGLHLSVIGFGGAPLGGFRADVDEAGSDATLTASLDGGMSYFDTAPLYGYGRSEHRLGHVLRAIDRGRFTISTKVGRYLTPLRPGESGGSRLQGGLPFRAVFDYSRDGVMRAFEQSLHRLGLGRIDMVLIHDADAAGHGGDEAAAARFRECMAGAVPALTALRASGDIAAWGVGLNDTAQALRFLRETDLDCVMLAGRYTLLDQSALPELLPDCARRQVGMLMAGPFNSGILATGATPGALYRYRPADDAALARTAAIERLCAAHGVPLRAAAVQFPLGHPAVTSVVAGASSPEMAREILDGARRAIPAQLWRDLRAEGLVDPACPVPGDGLMVGAGVRP